MDDLEPLVAADRTAEVPTAADLRRVVDGILKLVGTLPDDAWDATAHGLTWDCRGTIAHLADDLAYYALQLSGTRPPQTAYLPLVDPPEWSDRSPKVITWPDPATGTAGVAQVLDATAGLLCAVVATAPPDRLGFHPHGLSDASGFAAMGIVEAALHGWDVLTAHDVPYRADAVACTRTLNRLFPDAERTDDPWQDLLRAGGRTEDAPEGPWRWDSSVRPTY